jgi:hypothetical protein
MMLGNDKQRMFNKNTCLIANLIGTYPSKLNFWNLRRGGARLTGQGAGKTKWQGNQEAAQGLRFSPCALCDRTAGGGSHVGQT